jgi:hypothetical protein
VRGGAGSGVVCVGVGVGGGGAHTHTFQASGHVCERSPRCSYAGHGASQLNILNIYIEVQAGNDRLTDRQSNQAERDRETEREEYKQKRSCGLQQETIEDTAQTTLHQPDRQTLARNWPRILDTPIRSHSFLLAFNLIKRS